MNRKDTCTPMFVAILFTIAKTWKQLKCPYTDEWTLCIYTHLCIHNCIHTQCNTIHSLKDWRFWQMPQHGCTLRTLSQVKYANHEKDNVWFHLYDVPRVVKLRATESRLAVTGDWGREMGSYCLTLLVMFKGYRVSVSQDGKRFRDVCWWWLHNNVNIIPLKNG